MIPLTLSILFLTLLASAQNSTVSLFIPIADPQSLEASIAGSDSTATTYIVNCPTSTPASASASLTGAAASATGYYYDNIGEEDDEECGFPNPFTIVQGPSTMRLAMTLPEVGAESLACALQGTTRAVCTASASGSALTAGSNPIPPVAMQTLAASEISFLPVKITAGSAGSALATGTATGSSSGGGGRSGTATESSSAGVGATNAAAVGNGTAQGVNTGGKRKVWGGVGVVGAVGVAVAGAIV